MGVVGNSALFGPCIFVNNQLEVVIISMLSDVPKLVSATPFPLGTPGISSYIVLSGETLVVVQQS